VVVAGAIAVSDFAVSGHGSVASPAADAGISSRAATGAASAAAAGASARKAALAAMPQTAAAPHVAVMPKSGSRASGSSSASASASASSASASVSASAPSGSGSGSGSQSASASPSGSASPPATSGAPSPSSSPAASASIAPVPSGSASCTNPSFSTSAQYGIWNLSPYFVYNNMWGISGYNVTQTLSACSYSNWYVTADMNNDSGDGHVKTYPNSQRDFNEPKISSLNSVTSTFAETSPGTGIYEDAYDIWLNGVATSGSTEVMIWTQNNGQTPSGTVEGTVTVNGQSYTVWKTGTYIAFVANANFTSGTMNLLAFFQWIIGKGWIPADSTLGQVCYGAELVSTNGVPATFTFSNYSVNAS
jgi:hypothetical protein